ncbi:recombinase family protein [Streptomyces himalayensis]|uniref:Recombinase family protein n=1 Tax=Streptomyces himalayensis subsp. himalayensis TaxID=2756131 RepID=A0A7W0I8U8_9ACTN|nr:recombinase family protein [Streptomyces himalayensis]MBA2946712.1 recombinase family protein [Streptomyces himalayensis subsp. himalayensis]
MTKTLTPVVEVARGAVESRQLRAVDYLRVSTGEQLKGYGIAYTGMRTKKHIEKKGWLYVRTYADEGYSGSLEAHQRPDVKKLMEAARQTPRPFDVVVVAEERAIGRAGRAFWPWVWELEDLGVFVAIVKGDYDNTTADGRSRMRKAADRAEDERETIRERTQGGIQEKAADGLYPGGMVPFGYRVAEQGKKGVSYYAVDETEAATLRRARQLFLAKRSWTAVALTLNSEERYSRSDKPWTRKNIRCRMLGEAVLERRIVWRGKSVYRDQDGDPVYGEIVVINLPEIFTDKETEELKAAAQERPRPVQSDPRVYLLTGLMTSPCGRTYEGHQHRPTEVIYRCKGRQESYAGAGDQCSCPYLEATAIERQVWGDAVNLLSDAERMKAMAQDWIGATVEQRVDHTKRIAELDQQIAEQSDVIDTTMAVAARQAAKRGLRGGEAEGAVERAVRPLNEELEGLEKLRRDAVAWQQEAAEVVRRLEALERLAAAARKNLQNIEPHEKAELLDMMGLQAEVVRCAPRRKGVACGVRNWFLKAGRGVPVLDDEGWERIRHLMGGSRSTLDRRTMVEAMLTKAVTGTRWEDSPALGNPRSLQTQAYRWVASGVWGQAMDLLTDVESRPVWMPDPVEIRVSLRPLAVESRPGDEERDGLTTAGQVRLSRRPLRMATSQP